jgi:hypothetical protein
MYKAGWSRTGATAHIDSVYQKAINTLQTQITKRAAAIDASTNN